MREIKTESDIIISSCDEMKFKNPNKEWVKEQAEVKNNETR